MSVGVPSYIILRALESSLAALAADHKGSVVVAHDPAEAIFMLRNAPQQWRIILGVDDETSAEDKSYVGTSNTEIYTIIQAGVGLPNTPGAAIHRERTAAGPSVLEIAEAVRCWVRGLNYEHVDIDCAIQFNWRRSTWATAQEEGKPAQFGRQHIFEIQHRTSAPADLAPAVLNHP
jgi:hypothetical protein